MARTVKCPSCGAELTAKDDNRDFMFCEFCGTKVRLDDYQETHRYVDEARIHESKDAKEIKLRELEAEEKEKEANRKYSKFMGIIGFIMVVFFTLLLFLNNLH